jgi:hypothetical protein
VICPHCGIGTSPNLANRTLGSEAGSERELVTGSGNCTECLKLIVVARWIEGAQPYVSVSDDFLIYPPGASARPTPREVLRSSTTEPSWKSEA